MRTTFRSQKPSDQSSNVSRNNTWPELGHPDPTITDTQTPQDENGYPDPTKKIPGQWDTTRKLRIRNLTIGTLCVTVWIFKHDVILI